MSYNKFRDWLAKEWPNPPETILARLRHTLDVFDSKELDGSAPKDEDLALVATGGMYVSQDLATIKTGLTWGDLRTIRRYLEHEWARREDDPFTPLVQLPIDFSTAGQKPKVIK